MKPEVTKRYIGLASNEGLDNVLVHTVVDGAPVGTYTLPLHLDLRHHSPTGFAWGYCGSGPAQLALAICIDYLCDMRGDKKVAEQEALEIYMMFKDRVIARLDMNSNFVMNTQDVALAIEAIENQRPRRVAR